MIDRQTDTEMIDKKERKKTTTHDLGRCFIPDGSTLGCKEGDRDCMNINGSVIHRLQSCDIHLPFSILTCGDYFSNLLP